MIAIVLQLLILLAYSMALSDSIIFSEFEIDILSILSDMNGSRYLNSDAISTSVEFSEIFQTNILQHYKIFMKVEILHKISLININLILIMLDIMVLLQFNLMVKQIILVLIHMLDIQ